MRTHKTVKILVLLSAFATATFGVSCLQQDPGLISDLENTRTELEETKKQLQDALAEKASVTATTSNDGPLALENAELKAQVESLQSKISELGDSSFKALSQEELTMNLMAAAIPYKSEIEGIFEVEEASVKNLFIPDFSEHPYRCVFHLKLIETETGAKKQLDIAAKGDPQGRWVLPSMEELQKQVKPRAASVTPQPPAYAPLPSAPNQLQGNQGPYPPSPDSFTPQINPPQRSAPIQPSLPGELKGEIRIPW